MVVSGTACGARTSATLRGGEASRDSTEEMAEERVVDLVEGDSPRFLGFAIV